jgi:hypothetical protein
MANETLEFAWACGLFEGEGHVMHRPNGRGSVTRGLYLAMADKDVVDRFAAVMDGSVRGPKARPQPHWKPLWEWQLGGWGNVAPLAERMLPFLGQRRAEAVRALLADPPTAGKWQQACRCGRKLVSVPGDSGRRCPTCRPASKRAQERKRVRG